MLVCLSRLYGKTLIRSQNIHLMDQKITCPWPIVTKYKIFPENYCNIRYDYANVNNCVR